MADCQNMAQELIRIMGEKSGHDKELTALVAKLSNEERVALNRKYSELQKAPLVCDILQKYSGDFGNLIACLFEGKYYTWARVLHQSLKGIGTDEKLLLLTVLLMDADDYVKVSLVYEHIFGRNMYKDIAGDVSGNLESLLLSWLRNAQNCVGDPEKLARDLNKAANGLGTNEKVFIAIIVNSSTECFQAASLKYEEIFKRTLEDEIKREFSSNLCYALLIAIYVKSSRINAVAWLLYKSMKGFGTDEYALNLLTALFADTYGGEQIHQAFKGYGDLSKWIAGDTSSSYEQLLKQMWLGRQ